MESQKASWNSWEEPCQNWNMLFIHNKVAKTFSPYILRDREKKEMLHKEKPACQGVRSIKRFEIVFRKSRHHILWSKCYRDTLRKGSSLSGPLKHLHSSLFSASSCRFAGVFYSAPLSCCMTQFQPKCRQTASRILHHPPPQSSVTFRKRLCWNATFSLQRWAAQVSSCRLCWWKLDLIPLPNFPENCQHLFPPTPRRLKSNLHLSLCSSYKRWAPSVQLLNNLRSSVYV